MGPQAAGSDRPKLPVEVTEKNPWVDRHLSEGEAPSSAGKPVTEDRFYWLSRRWAISLPPYAVTWGQS